MAYGRIKIQNDELEKELKEEKLNISLKDEVISEQYDIIRDLQERNETLKTELDHAKAELNNRVGPISQKSTLEYVRPKSPKSCHAMAIIQSSTFGQMYNRCNF